MEHTRQPFLYALVAACVLAVTCTSPENPYVTTPTIAVNSNDLTAWCGIPFDTLRLRVENEIYVHTWSVAPELPEGLQLDPEEGTIWGVPKSPSPRTLYTIRAEGSEHTGEMRVHLRVLPASPTGFLSHVDSSQSVVLKWTSPEIADSFVVYRTDHADSSFIAVAVVDDTSYHDTAVETNTTYFYTVTTMAALVGESRRSGTLSAYVLPHPKTRPIAVLDSFSCLEDETLIVSADSGLLLNDTWTGKVTLVIALVDSPQHGLLSVHDSGGFRYIPDTNWAGTDSFAYRALARDSIASEESMVRITVKPTNDPPLVTGQRTLSTPEDTGLALSLTDFTVYDPDNVFPDGFTLWAGGGDHHTASGRTITPAMDFNGDLRVPVRVFDGTDSSKVFEAVVSVTPVNDPPVLKTHGPLGVSEGESATLSGSVLSTTDADNGPGDLEYTLISAPANGTLTLPGQPLSSGDTFTQQDIVNRHLLYTHDGSESDSDDFTFSVSDGNGGHIPATSFPFLVTLTNEGPSFTTSPTELPSSVRIGRSYAHAITAADPDGDNLTFTLLQGPSEATIGAATGDLAWYVNPATQTAGNVVSLTIVVSDGELSDTLDRIVEIDEHMWEFVYDYSGYTDGVLFAAADDSRIYLLDLGRRLLRSSTNGGESWNDLAQITHYPNDMKVSAENIYVLVNQASNPAYEIFNGTTGASIASDARSGDGADYHFDVSPNDQMVVVYFKAGYMTSPSELFVFDYPANAEHLLGSAIPSDIELCANIVYVISEDTLHVRSSGSWTKRDLKPGISATFSGSLESDHSSGDTLYVWDANPTTGGLYYSTNATTGAFAKLTTAGLPGDYESFAMLCGRLGWVVTSLGVYFTRDGHSTYTEEKFPNGFSANEIQSVYIAADGRTAFCYGAGKLFRY